ncbi:MAG: hypothetical protein NUW09_00380 [Deltaproteobacteria bacterium]|nr:hypothetical protein [Deltaproteobacteria bacterium]
MRIVKEDVIGGKEEISMKELIDTVKGNFLNPQAVFRNLFVAPCFAVQVGPYTYRVSKT